MPIDYSRFDGIGDDDDDDEDDRRASRRGGGGGGGSGGEDFERLLQQCLRQVGDKDAQSAEPPDLFAAAGLGRGSGGGAGGRGANGAPLPAPAAPGIGLGALDPLGASLDDGLGGLDGGLGSSRSLDFAGLRAEAWRLLCQRLVVLPGPAEAVPRQLLLEAEVHLLASRYRQALVAALALQLATAEHGGAELPYGNWTAPAAALEMICSYQLGDRDRAVQLREALQTLDKGSLSQHLLKRYQGTCEVLELVPQFLSLLKAAEQEQKMPEQTPEAQFAGR